MIARWTVAAVLALALQACSPLPDIEAGVCGNAVLEPGEDCDGFPRKGLACRAPGTLGQCRMDCSPAADGTRTACPGGWGCDAQNVCRQATGVFQALPDRIPGSAWSLAGGDFDGDGQGDVVSSERASTFGLSKLRVHYFDRAGAPRTTFAPKNALSTPVPFMLPGDTRSDLAYVAGGSVGLLSGEPDGSLITEALPSYFVAGSETRMVTIDDRPIRDSAALLVVSRLEGQSGLFRQSLTTARIELSVELPGGPEDLAADPLAADLFEDDARFPCHELALAFRGARELSVYAACEYDPVTGELIWREQPLITELALEPEDRISSGLVAADLDADGHLDLLVGAEGGPYVAYGDGETLGPMQPARVADGDAPPMMPLAAGDLSGDGLADLVLPGAVLIADPSADPRAPHYDVALMKLIGAPWSEALIADFNRDGNADLAAASAPSVDIDFFNGNGSEGLAFFTISTDRPAAYLAAGDLDGDLVNDLAFVQRGASTDPREQVSIAFGKLAGAPEQPEAVARLQDVQQVLPFRAGFDGIWNLGLVYRQDDEEGVPGSAVALFPGSSDRRLPCLVELSNFSEDGTLASAMALTLTVGAFAESGRRDALALAVAHSRDSEEYELWLVPDLDDRLGSSVRLGWGFPTDLQPLIDRDGTPQLAAAMATADLDDDGHDELVLAGPDGTGTRCLVASARIAPDESPRVQVERAVVLEDSCTQQPQLSTVDLDDDGAQDVLLLAGTDDGERRLYVLWGDGSTRLDASRLDQLSPDGEQPQAFAPYRESADAPLQIAYVTSDGVKLLGPGKNARSFEPGDSLAALERGTGIVAADVDGDGVVDLALADAGEVRVLRAALEAP